MISQAAQPLSTGLISPRTSLLWLCCLPLDMNQMNVDPLTSPSSSSSKRLATSPLTSSSAGKRPRILLPDAQLTALNHNMKGKSKSRKWQVFLKEARDNNSLWLDLLSEILSRLTAELAFTNMKGSVIASPNFERADDIVKSFNEDELEQWKVGVRNGVEKNDWLDLIAHRTLHFGLSDHQITFNHINHSETQNSKDAERIPHA
jgi:hypothetical protein